MSRARVRGARGNAVRSAPNVYSGRYGKSPSGTPCSAGVAAAGRDGGGRQAEGQVVGSVVGAVVPERLATSRSSTSTEQVMEAVEQQEPGSDKENA